MPNDRIGPGLDPQSTHDAYQPASQPEYVTCAGKASPNAIFIYNTRLGVCPAVHLTLGLVY